MPWYVRRLFPLLATVLLIADGVASTTWWDPAIGGKSAWALPYDLWGTLAAAQRLIHLDLAGIYTPPTSLVSFPGAAVILVPVTLVIDAAGLSLRHPGPLYGHPAAWLIAGPYEIAISGVALFAADSLAESMGVSRRKRLLLQAASAVALWSVSVRWGHPEDAVAVGLFLYAIRVRDRPGLAGWLTGAAIAVQPLVLLAVPVLLAVTAPRRIAGFCVRAAAPAVVLLGAAAAANWSATVTAVTSQPNSPVINHPTPWTSLAGHLSGGSVAAGPARALSILVAVGCALFVARRKVTDTGELLWWVAVTLALRSVFEPVMVSYYLWPPLAVALIAAARGWPRLVAASVIATGVTFASQGSWRGLWTWWAPMIAGLCLMLLLSRSRRPFVQAPVASRPRVSR
jgi:hypothetical protein